MQPLLTIAIPTYNRAGCLGLLLEYLAPQLFLQPDVELIISDNASVDETASLVASFIGRGLAVRYVRNEQNVGLDGNFLQCFALATGRYVWLLGDDDVIVPGALERLVELLRADDYSLVYVTSQPFRDTFVPPALPSSELVTRTFSDVEALARKVHIFFTFISSNIVNKEALGKVDLADYASLIGTNLLQLGWIYGALEQHRKSLFVYDALVAAKVENTGGYGLCQTFGGNLQRITNDRLSSRAVQRIILNSSIQRLLPQFLLRIRSGSHAFSSETPHSILRPVFGNNLRYWFFAYPLLALPVWLAKAWLFVIRVVNCIDRWLAFPRLA